MLSIGLDIGTTTICAVVFDPSKGEIVKTVTEVNGAELAPVYEWEKLQNPDVILNKTKKIVNSLTAGFDDILCIGITGQMHGILYIDEKGDAVSPLYCWQDGRGNLEYGGGVSYAEYLSEKSGLRLAGGYGSATHFYNVKNKLAPENAVRLCTVYDYAAMKLCGRDAPVISPSSAAGLGLFDVSVNKFRGDFFDISIFPEVDGGISIIGETEDGIKVAAAIGDNQASFLGSVRNPENSVLVNVGTGSQVSVAVNENMQISGLETRPNAGSGFLLVGAPLCGGRAYALLKEFYSRLVVLFGVETEQSAGRLYEIMNKMAGDVTRGENFNSSDKIKAATKFSGTRENPLERASFSNIGINNFTPGHFTLSVISGIVDELYEMFAKTNIKPGELIGSGNGIRQNSVMRDIFSQKFNLPLKIPFHKEEAAFGACLFALTAAGFYENLDKARENIKYE
jgi:sedoheptulokinase